MLCQKCSEREAASDRGPLFSVPARALCEECAGLFDEDAEDRMRAWRDRDEAFADEERYPPMPEDDA